MNISVNDEPVKVTSNMLINALQEAGVPIAEGMAIAVNDTVVPRRSWMTYILHEHDNVLIIKAAQGG